MSSCRKKDSSQNEEEVIPTCEEVKVGAKPRLYLEKWCVRLRGGEMYVEGHLLDKHLALCPGIYSTSRICRVLEPCRLEGSSGREYILEGALFPRESEVEGFVSIALTPQFVLDSFSHGFPPNWTSLRDNWSLYVGRQLEARRQARDSSLLATLTSQTAGRVPLSPLHLLASPHRSSSSPSVLHTRETSLVMKRGRDHILTVREQGINQKLSDDLKVPSMKIKKTDRNTRTNQKDNESKEKSIKTTTKHYGIGEKTNDHAEKMLEAGTMVITRKKKEKKNNESNILEACNPIMTGGNIMKENKSITPVRKSPRMSLTVNPKTPGARERPEDQNLLNTTAKSSPARKRIQSSLFWHAEYARVEAEISRMQEVSSQQAKEKKKIPTKVIPKLSKKGPKKNRKYDNIEAGSPNRKPSITGVNNMKSSETKETQESQHSSNTTARSSPRKRTQNSPFWHTEYKRVEAEMAREKEILSKETKKAKKV